jgi:ABC-2 type transport system ATP-binding protein
VNETFSQDDGSTIISTNKLTKAFGNHIVVNNLDLQVRRGDVFGFLGPNGSGKTTTIRILLGLIRPTAGHAMLFGMDNASHLPAILQRLGAIVEMPMFYTYLSGVDNLRIAASTSGMASGHANDHRLAEVLEIVDLQSSEKLAYRKYSLGMKQRLGIAAALLADPELVLLDEPTNGLDPAGVFEMRQLIQRLSSLGKTIFISSHILYEVQHVCNRVAILQNGNLVTQGNVSELLRKNEQIEIRLTQEDETFAAQKVFQQMQSHGADWIQQVRVEHNRQNQLLLLINAPIARLAEVNAVLARHNFVVAELYLREGNLEEAFLQLTATPASTAPSVTQRTNSTRSHGRKRG